MITVVHERHVTWYREEPEEPEETLGFYSRAAYAIARDKPNYPLPAIRAMVSNAQRLIQFGEIIAENGFDLPTVFERYVKLR